MVWSGWPSSSGLSAAVWAVVTQPAVVSGSSAHPARSAKVVMVRSGQRTRHVSLLAPQEQHELDSSVLTNNTHSSSSLSDSESVTSGLGPAGWILLTGGVDDKRGGGRHNVFAVYCTLRATSQWLSHVHIVKWPCCHLMQLGPPEVLDFVAAQHAVA